MAARRHEEDEDTPEVELAPLNGHAKWVIGVVSAAIVAGFGWLASENYRLTQERLQALEARGIAVDARVYAHDAQLSEVRANIANMVESQRRTEAMLNEALRRGR